MPDISGMGLKCNVHNGRMTPGGDLEHSCGGEASLETDGSEVDQATTLVPVEDLYGLGPGKDVDGKGKPIPRGKPQRLMRKAVPGLRVCDHHLNWPFSSDAKQFAKTPAYERQQAEIASRGKTP